MQSRKKSDYLKFLLLKVQQEISLYEIREPQVTLLENIFGKISSSPDPLKDAFILSRVKGFEKIGRYLVYIIKKLDEGIIKYENLSQNLNSDTKFFETELLKYFSNPDHKVLSEDNEEPDEADSYKKEDHDFSSEAGEMDSVKPERKIRKDDDEREKFDAFKKHYLELIQSEPEQEDDSVYELPEAETRHPESQKEEEPEFYDEYSLERYRSEQQDEISEEEDDDQEFFNQNILENKPPGPKPEVPVEEEISPPKKEVTTQKLLFDDFEEEPAFTEKKKNFLEEEVSEILDDFKSGEKVKQAEEEKPTNAVFILYEEEIVKKNELLKAGFDDMLEYMATKSKDRELRESIIKNISETSSYLEEYSRKLSLEIISNVYQTITLSFEKISEGKYDISDTTLNLFKSSLEFVLKLLKGEDYYAYEITLKSIENLRNSLLEEKIKKEKEVSLQKEMQDLELMLIEKYPDARDREKIKELKVIIKKIQDRFDSIDKVTGEYQVYEALRSLSGNLPYLKEIVGLSKDLHIPKLAKLAEGSYIFIKFLQNYRIDPFNPSVRDIFNYITHNLKLLIFDKHSKDLDLFISYLNDPVKIFSKPEKKL
jgi:hypothetical protein